MSGVLLALWALGSLLAGLVTGAIAWRRGPAVRVRSGSLGDDAAPWCRSRFVDSLRLMASLLLVGGLSRSRRP